MNPFTLISYIIIAFICFLFAPFMTIGVCFILGGFKIIGAIFLILGLIHMVFKISN